MLAGVMCTGKSGAFHGKESISLLSSKIIFILYVKVFFFCFFLNSFRVELNRTLLEIRIEPLVTQRTPEP